MLLNLAAMRMTYACQCYGLHDRKAAHARARIRGEARHKSRSGDAHLLLDVMAPPPMDSVQLIEVMHMQYKAASVACWQRWPRRSS